MVDVSLAIIQLDRYLDIDQSVLTILEEKANSDGDLSTFLIAIKGYFAKSGDKVESLDSEQQIHSLELRSKEFESSAANLKLRVDELQGENAKLEEMHKSEIEKYKATESELSNRVNELQNEIQLLTNTRNYAQQEGSAGTKLHNQNIEPSTKLVTELQLKSALLETMVAGFKTDKLAWESEKINLEGQIKNLKQDLELVKREWDADSMAGKEQACTKEKTSPEVNPSTEPSTPNFKNQEPNFDKYRQEMSRRLSWQLSTIQDLRSQLALQETNFHTELAAQSKLLEYHISAHNELEAQNSAIKAELIGIKENDSFQVQHLEAYEAESQTKFREQEAKIAQLQSQLNEYNAIPVGTNGSHAETIVLISKAQKGGKTFTEVFNDYVQAKRELLESQSNTKALRQSLDLLTRTLEEQTPLLKEQRLDYDRLLDEASQMADLLNQTKLEHSRTLDALKEAKECESLLKKEVLLLKEEFRASSNDDAVDDKSLHDKIIELKLKMESEEARYLSDIGRLETSLGKEWQDKVEALSQQVLSQAAKVQALETEREILSEILSRKSQMALNTDPQDKECNTSLLKAKQDLENTCKELGNNFNQLKAQHDSLKLDRDEKVRRSAYLEAQLTLYKDRIATFQKTSLSHRNEAQELRRRNMSLEEMLNNREKYCSKLMDTVADSQANLEEALLQASDAKAECDLLKKSEERLRHDNKSLIQEKSFITSQMIDLQLKIDTLAQNEITLLKQTSARIQVLKEERDASASALEKSHIERDALRQAHDKMLSDHQAKIDQLNASVHSTQEKLLVTSEAFKNSQLRLEELEEENRKIKDMFDSIAVTKNAKEEFLATLSQLQEAQEALALSRQSEAQFQAICKASEEALQTLHKTYEDYKVSASEVNSEKERQIQHYVALEKERFSASQHLADERERLSEELISTTKRFQQHITTLDDEIIRYKEEISKLTVEKLDVEPRLTQLVNSEETARRLYEKEVTSHAAKIRQFAEAQTSIAALNAEVLGLKNDLTRIQKENLEIKSEAAAEQDRLVNEMASLKERITAMQKSNDELLDQTCASKIDALNPGTPSLGLDLKELSKKLNLSQAQVQALEATNRRLELEKKRLLDQLRAESDGRWQASQADEHLARIAELTQKVQILTESSGYLRKENQTIASQLALAEEKQKSHMEKVELVQEQMREIRSEMASKERNLQEARAETARWKLKLQGILDKSEKINPDEHNQLKAKLLETEAALEKVTAEFKELETSSKEEIKLLNIKSAKLNQTGLAYKRELQKLKAGSPSSDTSTLTAQLQEANKAKTELESKLAQLTESLAQSVSKDEMEAAVSKAVEFEKLYTSLRDLALKHKNRSVERGQEIMKLKNELSTLNLSITAKDAEVKTLSESMDAVAKRNDELEQNLKENIEHLKKVEAESKEKLDKVELQKSAELAAAHKENETKLHNLEMRHKARLSRPLKIIKQLQDQIAALEAAQLPQETPAADPEQTTSSPEEIQELKEPEGTADIELLEPVVPSENLELMDEVEISPEEPSSTLNLKRSQSLDTVDSDPIPTKKHRAESSESEATPNFTSPLIETELAPESPSPLELELIKLEPCSPEPDDSEKAGLSDDQI